MRSKCALPADAWFNCVATARNSVSLIRVDLPEPDTPVTQVINPKGNYGVTFFRLPADAWFNCVAAARNSVSLIRVDLPEPDTPVTQVINPKGNSAVTFFRLLA